MKLSACLVIRNEEKLLERCLKSIIDVADEIVVVHDGECSDSSLDIAKKYNAKVFVKDFVGEAEYHRPFSYDQAAGEWILQIDADEFLSEKAKQEIPKLIRSTSCDGYSLAWPYFDGKKYIQKGPFARVLKPCLFRKSMMYMLGISHEYPRTNGKLRKRADIQLEHKPLYDNYTHVEFHKKWKRWAMLQALQIYQLEKAPRFHIEKPENNPTYRYYENIRHHPLLSVFVITFRFVALYLTRGIILAGRKSYTIAYLEIRYHWYLYWHLFHLNYG